MVCRLDWGVLTERGGEGFTPLHTYIIYIITHPSISIHQRKIEEN